VIDVEIEEILSRHKDKILKVFTTDSSHIILPREEITVSEFLDIYEDVVTYSIEAIIRFDPMSGGLQIVVPH